MLDNCSKPQLTYIHAYKWIGPFAKVWRTSEFAEILRTREFAEIWGLLNLLKS